MSEDNLKKELTTFYLYFLVPGLISLLLLAPFPISIMNMFVFALCYVWNIFLITPNLGEKVQTKSYRFSLIKFLYEKGHLVMNSILKYDFKYKQYLARALIPLAFILFCKILYFEVSFFMGVLGLIFFELMDLLYKKRNKHP